MIIFPMLDGLVPYDGVPTEEYVTVGVPVTVVYILLSVIGIIFAVLCLIFNFVYRNKRYKINFHFTINACIGSDDAIV